MSTPEPSRDKPVLLLLLPHEWRSYARRPHWQAMAQLADLIAVEPPVGLLAFWRHPERLLSFVEKNGWGLRGSEDNLHFMRPLSFLTYGIGHRLPWLARFDRWLIGWQLRRLVRPLRANGRRVVVFLVKIEQSYLAGTVDADLNCYEVTDEYRVKPGFEEYSESHPFTARAIAREARILNTADLVITSSADLKHTRSQHVANTHHLPNCADYKHFARAALPETEIPDSTATLPHPRIGFTGNMTNLIDVTLLNRVADAFPQGSLVLVGREEGTPDFRGTPDYQRLKTLPNVHFLGFQDYDLLPGFIKGFDVCLMPYFRNPWMRASSPNKTYQYLSTGKPVVSVLFPEVEPLDDVVYVASREQEFVPLIKQALEENNPELAARRQAVAREHTTEKRAEKVLRLVMETLVGKASQGH